MNLVVSISGHGFGHVAQTAPILNLLHERMPRLRLTVRSAVPLTHLRSRIHAPFDHLQSHGDIGMVMSSALDVLVEDSRAAYRAFHADWDARVAEEAHLLRELAADAVFSNVGYLPLAGAQQLGIPSAALCSLNWFDIYRHFCVPHPVHPDRTTSHSTRLSANASQVAGYEHVEGRGVHASTSSVRTVDEIIAGQICASYANANAFLRTTPGMEMAALPNLIPVAPIAAIGENKRDELNRRLRLSKEEKLVLVSMGGIAGRLPMERWPRIDGVRWLVQDSWQVAHPDAIVLESLAMSFGDLLASSDALLCKPGYGSFVEAACSGIPVLYVSRADWPESAALTDWLQTHGACREISRDQLESGAVAQELVGLWSAPPPALTSAAGASQVADWLIDNLALSGN